MGLQQKMAVRPFHPTLGHSSIVLWNISPRVFLSLVWDCQHWGFHDLCREDEEFVLWSEEDPQTPACSTKHRNQPTPWGSWRNLNVINEPAENFHIFFLCRRKPHIRILFKNFSPWLNLSYIDAFSLTFELMSQMSPVNSRWAATPKAVSMAAAWWFKLEAMTSLQDHAAGQLGRSQWFGDFNEC